ncbi:putative pectinesterase/pectinesterase inhibitor 35 [Curcuma longa]|uniref:putative pectinesterase/pectinesterase inhibitor 35 n=1 Tax=Curcuma longa TaxID=136217 RepID=UPI003D9F5C70
MHGRLMSRARRNELIAWRGVIFIAVALSGTVVSRAAADAGGEDLIFDVCKSTLYPEACEESLAAVSAKASPKKAFQVSVEYAKGRARAALGVAYNLTSTSASKSTSKGQPSVADCIELLDATLEQLDDVLDPGASFHDAKTWLSAALSNQVTCADGLSTVKAKGGDALSAQVDALSRYISNSLALQEKVKESKPASISGGRKLLSDGFVSPGHPNASRKSSDDFPAWVMAGVKRLLEASNPAEVEAVAVVAKDGSGTHATINEALKFVASMASKKGKGGGGGGGGGGTKVIYVKAGTYNEYINIPTKQKNVMLMGDGKGKSVIVGSRNANDGYTTYGSATVAAMGSGFIAKGITIINKSGPSKHQAVALRVGGDKSVVYQCSLQGYQDTLYTHSNRQFYSDTDIYGTVDFIFGNSAVVIQNCYIQPRKPGGGQRNSVTAQGRTDPNQNTGISIQKCRIQGAADLGGTPTYLGRPWKKYARTVVMQTYMDDSIESAGWEEWSGSFALSTLYYGEYANTGPGASVSGRVKWAGVHSSLSAAEASKFTVAEFIVGDYWLPSTGVGFTSGL